MYIHSYTSVFHSQLPFFCRISFSPIWFFFLFISFFISIFRFTTNTAVTERQGNSCPMLIFISLFTFTSHSRIRIRIRRPANKLSSERFRNVFLSFHSLTARGSSIRFALDLPSLRSLRPTSARGRVSWTFDAGGHSHVNFT